MTILIKRLESEIALSRHIAADRENSPCLPVVSSEPGWKTVLAAVGVDPKAGAEGLLEWPVVLPEMSTHLVYGVGGSGLVALAAAYANLGSRPFVSAGCDLENDSLDGCESVTLVMTAESDSFRSYREIVEAVRRRFYRQIAIGVLIGTSLEQLSWLMVKQIRQFIERHDDPAVLVDNLSVVPAGKQWIEVVSNSQSVEDIVNTLGQRRNLAIAGHARPHCGPIRGSNGLAVLCTAEDAGRSGLCFDNRQCSFSDATRIPVWSLRADHLFYEGCGTAKFSETASGIPAAAMLCVSALRGQTAQIIGNFATAALSSPWDARWFMGLSGLHYPPARCVSLISEFRYRENREFGGSFIFLGDAASGAWPGYAVDVAAVELNEQIAELVWSRTGALLIAVVPGREWTNIALRQGLALSGTGPGLEQGSARFIVDNERDAVLILVATTIQSDAPIRLKLEGSLQAPSERDIPGAALCDAIDQLAFMELCPTFATCSTDLRKDMAAAGARLPGLLSAKNLLNLDRRVVSLRKAELETIRLTDNRILLCALQRAAASPPWHWGAEYAARLEPSDAPIEGTCSMCGQVAYTVDIRDVLKPAIRRKQVVCMDCGVTADLPWGPLEARLTMPVPGPSDKAVIEEVTVANYGERHRSVSLALCILGITGKSDASSIVTIDISPRAERSVAIDFKLTERLSGFHWVRAYISSHGGFGYVGRSFVF